MVLKKHFGEIIPKDLAFGFPSRFQFSLQLPSFSFGILLDISPRGFPSFLPFRSVWSWFPPSEVPERGLAIGVLQNLHFADVWFHHSLMNTGARICQPSILLFEACLPL